MIKPYYDRNGITLYLGDCREILPEMGDVDLVVTSPPYNLYKKWWESGSNGDESHKVLAKRFVDTWYPDEIPEKEYQAQERELLTAVLRKCKGVVCYNHKVRYAFKRAGGSFHPMAWLQGYPLWVEIIWDKGAGPALNCRRPIVGDERIFVLGKPKIWHNLKLTTVWRMSSDREAPGHPCAFPLELPSRCIAMFTDPGNTVLDYYCGSGTTLVAAQKLGRKGIGIEINEDYLKIAIERLRQEVLL